MGNCLPRLLSFGRSPMEGTPLERSSSTSSANSNQDGPMSFSNPMMLSQNSPYVSQLYAANVRRQRQAGEREKDIEEAKRARIQGLLEQISADIFTEEMKAAECAICMVDFEPGDCIRFLPCMHSFHKDCVDEWLHKSFTCPSCLEPVDSTILSSLTAHTQQTFQDLISSQEACASSMQPANSKSVS